MKKNNKCPVCGKAYLVITNYKDGSTAYKHTAVKELGFTVWKSVCFVAAHKPGK